MTNLENLLHEAVYSITVAEIIDLIEAANNGFVLEELIADESNLKATLSKKEFQSALKYKCEFKRK